MSRLVNGLKVTVLTQSDTLRLPDPQFQPLVTMSIPVRSSMGVPPGTAPFQNKLVLPSLKLLRMTVRCKLQFSFILLPFNSWIHFFFIYSTFQKYTLLVYILQLIFIFRSFLFLTC